MKATLKGLRILNTRPQNQAQALSQQITALKGIAIECPTIEIKATSKLWVNFLPDLHQVNQAIFISANAVHHCFMQLQDHHIPWPKHIQVIAIGHGSAKALHHFNIPVQAIPETPDSEHLLNLPGLQQLKNQIVLLFKGEGGRELIENTLLQREGKIISLCVYKRELPNIHHAFIHSLWQQDLVDMILLTSELSIQNLFKLFGKDAHTWLQEKTCLVISERLAKSASLYGMKRIIISHPDRMMQALLDYYQGLSHGQQQ